MFLPAPRSFYVFSTFSRCIPGVHSPFCMALISCWIPVGKFLMILFETGFPLSSEFNNWFFLDSACPPALCKPMYPAQVFSRITKILFHSGESFSTLTRPLPPFPGLFFLDFLLVGLLPLSIWALNLFAILIISAVGRPTESSLLCLQANKSSFGIITQIKFLSKNGRR